MKIGIKYLFITLMLLIFNYIGNVSAINLDKACGVVLNDEYKLVVMFETNGGEDIKNITYDNLDEIDLPVPVKKGYQFEGWYTNKKLTNKFDKNNLILYPYSTGCNVNKVYTEVYAKWKKIDSCNIPEEYNVTIKYITNSKDKYDDLKVKMGLDNKKVSLPIPKKEGYYFVGWYGDSEYRVLLSDDFISQEVIYTKVSTYYVDDDNCSFDKYGKIYAKYVDYNELMYMIYDATDNKLFMINDMFI